jgi:hypothetical protein
VKIKLVEGLMKLNGWMSELPRNDGQANDTLFLTAGAVGLSIVVL